MQLPATVSNESTAGITIAGADPSAPVRLTATTVDGAGASWSSSAVFAPSDDGVVDTAVSAPDRGSYTGAHATGPVWSMAPSRTGPVAMVLPRDGSFTVTYTATQAGHPSVSSSQRHSIVAPGVTRRQLTFRADGLVGVYAAPPPAAPPPAGTGSAAPKAAVLVFGGSEGGLGVSALEADSLAAHGHPALALAYFAAPGLPPALARVRLEYFVTALRWLGRQPGVDPHRLTVMGASRGSEAALLLGVEQPDLVHAVVAASPASFINPGYPDAGQPAWTWHGRPVPSALLNDFAALTPTVPGSSIRVDRIHGPLLLLCGQRDLLWPSCHYQDQLAARAAGEVTAISEPDGGHLVDFPLPNYPTISHTVQLRDGQLAVGGSVEGDALARLRDWPRLLDFLER